jgi:putative membrane protein insertion efficiency factor
VTVLVRALSLLREVLVFGLVLPLKVYKLVISPLLPPVCRYHPSCSVYAMGALRVHGPLKGSWLAARRLSRCHPFHAGGLDPVPPKDGVPAVTLLEESDPFVAERIKALPPPHLMIPRPGADAPKPAP